MMQHGQEEEQGHWVSMNDLLAGTLLFFVLLTIVFISEAQRNKDKQAAVLSALQQEFHKAGVAASVDPENGTIELADKILFDINEANLKPQGEALLDVFIPLLSHSIFKTKETEAEILSVSIVGYSSQKISDIAFRRKMMALSLDRSQSVWRYVTGMPSFVHKDKFIHILNVSGWGNLKAKSIEDVETDRKVIFKFEFRGTYEKIKESLLGSKNKK